MKTVVLVNPKSSGGRTERRWPALSAVLEKAIGPSEALITTSPGDATHLCRAALEGGAKRVIAIGGDGTINEVINGFFDGEKAVAPDAAFAVLNAGTGGDFVKSIGVPKDFEAACERLNQPSRSIDVGRLTYVAHNGTTETRHFINIASFGLSGLVDRYVNRSKKSFSGTVAFALGTLRASLEYKNAEVEMTLDDHAPTSTKIYNVAIANGRYFGGGMKVAPNAELDDGCFDVVTMGDMGISDLLLHGLDIYSGKHLLQKKVRVDRARRVSVRPIGSGEVLLDMDGEQPGRLPATFELLPRALRIIA